MMKIPPLERHNKPLIRLMERIEVIAKKYYCDFDLITKKEIKSTFSLRTTEEIMQSALFLYPELSALYGKGIATKHTFHKKLYEAVLAAHIYQERQKPKQGSELNSGNNKK